MLQKYARIAMFLSGLLMLVLLSLWLVRPSSAASSVTLDLQRQLTLDTVVKVSQAHESVILTHAARNKVSAGHDAVMQAALNNKAVYGLTVGVGWNKDKPVFQEVAGKRVLSPELLQLSRQFNLSSLRAHASGVGEPLPEHVVRAAMLIRLNTFLNGEAGVSPAVAQQYVDFLNKGITPIVPGRGSIGEADITLASHIGLAMVGEWDVWYQGKRRSARDAMNSAGLKPLEPVGKDFLSMLSTNAVMAAQAADVLQQSRDFYRRQVTLFALTLEGFNGNIAPFSHAAVMARPYPDMMQAAADIRKALQGSSLWQPSDKRALQDPLSYRSMAYTLGEVHGAMKQLEDALRIQINHSDDNPLVLIHGLPKGDDAVQMRQYEVDGTGSAAIVPTSNFNFLPVTSAASRLNESLAKLAEVMTQQILRMENPDMTKLPRFLAAAGNDGHAFGAIQKPFAASNQTIKTLAQPQWYAGVTLAGNIEDTAAMSEQTLGNSRAILNGLYEIAAYQLLHSSQAVDLRDDITLSAGSRKLMSAYREQVPFVKQDAATTPLIEKSMRFWKNYHD